MNLPLRIKKKQPFLKTFTILGIFMLILSLLCLFSPFIPSFDKAFNDKFELVYMIIGGICTPFFSFFTCYSIMTLISPQTALIIKDIGVYDYTMAGGGAGFIPAEAIVSLRVFGNNKKQYLGIRTNEDYNVNLGASTRAKREIRNNLESGMPAVIIKGSDIAIGIEKLQTLLLNAYNRPTPSQKPSEGIDIVEISNVEEDSEGNDPGFIAPDTDAPILTTAETEDLVENFKIDEEPDEKIVTPPSDDKPRIKSVDELLAQILNNKQNDN